MFDSTRSILPSVMRIHQRDLHLLLRSRRITSGLSVHVPLWSLHPPPEVLVCILRSSVKLVDLLFKLGDKGMVVSLSHDLIVLGDDRASKF